MDKEKLPLYELTINNIDYDAITAISLVDFPAIERDFLMFAKEESSMFQFGKADIEKKIITGPALIPNKNIYRSDQLRGEFEIFFSEDTVSKISQKFLKEHKQNSVTVQHQTSANNIYVFESWIIEDTENDKSNAIGFNDLPVGTWMVSMKIENDEIWDKIKEGEIKGFSVEAYVSQKLAELKIQDEIEDEDEEALKNIMSLLSDYLK
jgi:hypothetical protein